jgi:hypothetical protein
MQELSSPLDLEPHRLVVKVSIFHIAHCQFLEAQRPKDGASNGIDLTINLLFLLGTQRRTKKVVHSHSNEVNEDKKLKSTIKKFGKLTLDMGTDNLYRHATTARHR